jgi:ATP-dependent Clp protease, protease subunit
MNELFKTSRLIYAWNFVDFGFSERVIRQLHDWSKEPDLKEKMPTMLINSPGGSVADTWAIIDTVKAMEIPMRSIIIGKAESAALVLACSADKGERYIAKHSICLLHNYKWPYPKDINPDYKDLKWRRKTEDLLQQQLIDFYLLRSSLKEKKLKELLQEGDQFFSAEQAIQFGFCDKLL